MGRFTRQERLRKNGHVERVYQRIEKPVAQVQQIKRPAHRCTTCNATFDHSTDPYMKLCSTCFMQTIDLKINARIAESSAATPAYNVRTLICILITATGVVLGALAKTVVPELPGYGVFYSVGGGILGFIAAFILTDAD